MRKVVEIEASELSSLLSARLCHDLIGPVSAIGAALDVLEDETAEDMYEDAMDLIRESANGAWARLEFTRMAFGSAGAGGGRADVEGVKRVIDAMFAKAKSEIVWTGSGQSLEPGSARVLMNLVILAVEALPRGGVITIEITPDGSDLRLVCEGKRVRLAQIAVDALDGNAPENGYDARTIQPYFAGLLARRAGGAARAVVTEARVELLSSIPVSVALEPAH